MLISTRRTIVTTLSLYFRCFLLGLKCINQNIDSRFELDGSQLLFRNLSSRFSSVDDDECNASFTLPKIKGSHAKVLILFDTFVY